MFEIFSPVPIYEKIPWETLSLLIALNKFRDYITSR